MTWLAENNIAATESYVMKCTICIKLQIPLFLIICKTCSLSALLTAIRLSKTQNIIYNLFSVSLAVLAPGTIGNSRVSANNKNYSQLMVSKKS